MLHRIIGSSGSGKTEYLLSALESAIKSNKKCYLIVPEQSSVDNEALLLARFGNRMNMYCEVLNFERLPNRVAREYGNLASETLDKGGASALISVIAEKNKDKLLEYSAVASDTDFATTLFSLIQKLKTSLITPSMLSAAAEKISYSERLKAKLKDIALIYQEYENFFDGTSKDPREPLTKLGEELPEKPFFKNSFVFIDGYYSFTEQEYSIIRTLISQASEVYISFTLSGDRAFFTENKKASERVLALAGNKSDDYYTGDMKRGTNSLKYLEKQLFKLNKTPVDLPDGSIKLIAARNRFDEAEAAAREILSFVREGNRYKDVAVVCGNTDTYSGIVSSVFERADIKCYVSAKEELSAKPLFAFLLSSLAVVNDNFSLTSVKRYIKSGFNNLTVAESDAIISYASSWKLRGKAWYSDEDWTFDPEGYREGELTERGKTILKIVNRAKNKLSPALLALKEDLSQKDLTVEKGVKALYKHAISVDAPEILRKSAEKLLKKGEYEKAERETMLWNVFIDILDQLYKNCGSVKVTPKRLAGLTRLVCESRGVSAIPASADSVTFGDASLLRAGNKKLIIVLGAIDGEFPKNASEDNFFDSYESVALEEVGLSVADTFEKQIAENRFFVYSALTSACEKLVLCRPVSELSGATVQRSGIFSEIKSIYNINEEKFSSSDLLYSKKGVAAFIGSIKDSSLKTEIKNTLIKKGEPFFDGMIKICDRDSKINSKETKLLIAPTRIENYLLCPFSYFGNSVLSLKEKKENDWAAPEMGNYVHKMLDVLVSDAANNETLATMTDEEVHSKVETASETYINNYIGSLAMEDKRFKHTFDNLKLTVELAMRNIVKEFKESKFVPVGFEYKIGLSASPDAPAVEYEIDGKKIKMRGSIDRVDEYKADGKTYVRVIDYKTYDKALSKKALEYGIDAQMFHYLYAYCGDDKIPVGVVYHTVALPDIKVGPDTKASDVEESIDKTFKRRGVALDDREIVSAMNENPAFVPIKYKKDGDLSKVSAPYAFTSEEFVDTKKSLEQNVLAAGKAIFDGKMDITPNDKIKGKDPCKYCKLSPLCRGKNVEEIIEDNETEGDDDNG